MKCPINKFADCIENECPLYIQTCGLRSLLIDVGNIETALGYIENKINDLAEVIGEGLRCL